MAYKIRNQQTGEIKIVEDNELPNYGLGQTQPTAISPSTSTPTSPNGFGETTLGKAMQVGIPATQLGLNSDVLNLIMPGLKSGLKTGLERMQSEPKPQSIQEAVDPRKFTKDVLEPMVQPALGAGLMYKALPFLAPYATFKGLAGKTIAGAKKSAEAGKFVTWDALQDKVKKAVFDRFGETVMVRKTMDKIMSARTPAGIESIPETLQKTAPELLKGRKQLLETYGTSLLEKFTGVPLEKKIAGEVRTVLSQEVHRLAPATIRPDQIYSTYKKLGGDVPTWARNIILGALAYKGLGNLFWPIGKLAKGLQ